jgi:hypothetical protein
VPASFARALSAHALEYQPTCLYQPSQFTRRGSSRGAAGPEVAEAPQFTEDPLFRALLAECGPRGHPPAPRSAVRECGDASTPPRRCQAAVAVPAGSEGTPGSAGPLVRVKVGTALGGGRGMFAARALAAGEEVISIPRAVRGRARRPARGVLTPAPCT